LITAVSIIIDLQSKVVAFRSVADQPVEVVREHVLEVSRDDPRLVTTLVPQHSPKVAVPQLLHFSLVLNPGAVFGIGPGKRWFFVGFTVLALAFGLGMFSFWTGPRDRWAHAGIGLLIGGGLGNLYDRLVFGCVRDFLHPLPGWEWPFGLKPMGTRELWPYVSNLADLFLLVGIAILMVHLWRRDRSPSDTRATGAAQAS
jgi:signal peptidase II